ncbi:MAG: HD domain-containing protein [Bacilli bacterium]
MEQLYSWVHTRFSGDATGHDEAHTLRVTKLAVHIARCEGVDADELRFVETLALIHDGIDEKITSDVASEKGKLMEVLSECGFTQGEVDALFEMIPMISFSNQARYPADTLPLTVKIVQDADRLDAIGAIGIARTFAFGAAHNRPMYDASIPPMTEFSKSAYRRTDNPTFNHFAEKLLLLASGMHMTESRRIAAERHDFMRAFVAQFEREWEVRLD